MAKNKVCLFVYLMFGVFSFIHCQNIKLAGRYVENKTYGIKHDLNLLKDGSFQYVIMEGLASDTIVGEWNIFEHKQIILTPTKIKSYHIESKCDSCAESFRIKTYALPDNFELNKPHVKVYAKGELIEDGITNSVKNAIIQKADSIQINYFGFKPYVFIPQKENNAIACVFLIEEQQILLQREIVLKIDKNKLVTEKGRILKKHLE
jgi:hypothetical protein